MSRLVALHTGGSREPWQSLGLIFENDTCSLADVDLVVSDQAPGLFHWVISGDRDEIVNIDGISTQLVSAANTRSSDSLIGTQRMTHLDHVVVNTDNLDRTCASIDAALGAEMRREREVGNGVVQRFHKLENTIIEVVTGPRITTEGASLWGTVVSVDHPQGPIRTLACPITAGPVAAQAAPTLGQHTAQVLLQAGFTDQQIEKLRELAVI